MYTFNDVHALLELNDPR